jgi:hypothetical protein
MSFRLCHRALAVVLSFGSVSALLAAPQQPVVPGTGVQLPQVSDDFEDPKWNYVPKNPKSTEDINENQAQPTGVSTNGRWYEGIKRGHPDEVRRVPTPPGGLPGSTGALMMRSLFTGIPSRPSFTVHQDDFVANVQYRLKGPVAVSQTPSITTRVYLPPIAEWEKRNGPHFGFRAAVETTAMKEKSTFLFSSKSEENEVYWPGMFIVMESKKVDGQVENYAHFRIRAGRNGGDMKGPTISTTGWWTLGMSFTPDGMVHYYARPGVEELTSEDYITSQYPYGYRCERFRTFFYNVVNGDNGKTWSTAWIVDDPKVYIANSAGKVAAGRSPTKTTKR